MSLSQALNQFAQNLGRYLLGRVYAQASVPNELLEHSGRFWPVSGRIPPLAGRIGC